MYRPYTKQREFHSAGKQYRERLFRAGNQLGKTVAGSAEAAIHATGLYPKWWNGHVFPEANSGWCSGVTGEVTRDTIQRLLLGPIGEHGTGYIPKEHIHDLLTARGQADLIDTIIIKHVDGGKSRIKLKYFEQGREKFQADTLQWAWNDEEPPADIYSEILTRTNATGGIIWTTFTPLKGMSEVVRRFMMEPSPDRLDINMTIDDAEHISKEQRDRIIASYPPHEREARIKGTPALGSGRIFPITEEEILCEPFDIKTCPGWWRQIAGLDFGWDHPTAAVRLVHNTDDDIIYVTNCYRVKEKTPVLHASALKPWGKELPWAWPHDGLQHDKGSGKQLAEIYRAEGLNLNQEHAQFDDDRGNGVEAGIMDMLDRMQTGRWKVFNNQSLWLEEFRLYHRKDGKIVKEFDDTISASRYALMDLRHAETISKRNATFNRAPSHWSS